MRLTLIICAALALAACEPGGAPEPAKPVAAKEHGINISGYVRVGVVKR